MKTLLLVLMLGSFAAADFVFPDRYCEGTESLGFPLHVSVGGLVIDTIKVVTLDELPEVYEFTSYRCDLPQFAQGKEIRGLSIEHLVLTIDAPPVHYIETREQIGHRERVTTSIITSSMQPGGLYALRAIGIGSTDGGEFRTDALRVFAVAIPEPSQFLLLSIISIAAFIRRRFI